MKYARTNMRRIAERGFTLTEAMVAITLSVFLLMGLFTILQQTRKTSGTTSGLAQLQDDERVAMTVMTDIIQEAGYVPEANGSGQALFLTDTAFPTVGQIVSGNTTGGSVGETLTLRFDLGAGDLTLKCDGSTNTGTERVFEEVFEIKTNSAGVNQLVCIPDNTTSTTPVPLVNNVVNLAFQYAVNTSSAGPSTPSNQTGANTEKSTSAATGTSLTGNGCPADTYITTANMSANDWTNVCAVKVDILFVNPLYKPPGQNLPTPGQQPYITFERVIGILSKTGVNVVSATKT